MVPAIAANYGGTARSLPRTTGNLSSYAAPGLIKGAEPCMPGSLANTGLNFYVTVLVIEGRIWGVFFPYCHIPQNRYFAKTKTNSVGVRSFAYNNHDCQPEPRTNRKG